MPTLPAPKIVIVFPDTVAIAVLLLEKETGKPEDEEAEILNGPSPNVFVGNAPKVIVWLALFTVRVCCTLGAAL